MIEVQLITFGNENTNWLARTKEGLVSPVVNVHEGSAVEGNVNAARIAVWDRCGGDLLSFVDPDDVPVASSWERLYEALLNDPTAQGAYTSEVVIGEKDEVDQFTRLPLARVSSGPKANDPTRSPLVAHHLLVVRRPIYELIKPYAEKVPTHIEWLLAMAAYYKGGLLKLPEVGYYYRCYPKQKGSKIPSGIPNLKEDFLVWLSRQPK